MATPVTLAISTTGATSVGTHAVYLKQFWGGTWGSAVAGLYADEVNITAMPSFSTARLYRRYGSGMLPGEGRYSDKTRLSVNRYFVRVDLTQLADGTQYEWIGTVEIDNDRLLGAAAGKQELVCYGIEHALNMEPILHSRWYDSAAEEERDSGRGFTFNANRIGNRTNGRFGNSFLFADDPTDSGNRLWSTRSIVEYLVKHHAPRDVFGKEIVQFKLVDEENILPAWDEPVLQTHGRTVFELLNALVSRQRLMSWYVNITAAGTVEIKPFSLAEEKLQLEDGKAFEANGSQKSLTVSGDPTGDCVIVTASVDAVDQVIVQGARRTSTCTISYGGAELAEGWTAGQETAYETAASAAGDYPGFAEPAESERRNRDARCADELADVFRRFVLDGVFYAENEVSTDADRTAGGTVVFPGKADEITVDKKHLVPRGEVRMLQTLALQERTNYATVGSISTTGSEPREPLPPLVFAPLPDDTDFYVQIEKAGQVADLEQDKDDTNREWSASVRIDHDGDAILIDVDGSGMQHVIAATNFTPLSPAARHGERDVAKFDFQDFLWTITVADDRHAEAQFPEKIQGGVIDIRRRKWLDAGDAYRLDYICPDTVFRVDPASGAVDLSDGGFFRDDRDKLKQLAKLAFSWYGTNRAACHVSSGQLNPNLVIGDLVTTINGTFTVNSCVTGVSIRIPAGGDGFSPGPPHVTYTLQFGELDPLRAFPL